MKYCCVKQEWNSPGKRGILGKSEVYMNWNNPRSFLGGSKNCLLKDMWDLKIQKGD